MTPSLSQTPQELAFEEAKNLQTELLCESLNIIENGFVALHSSKKEKEERSPNSEVLDYICKFSALLMECFESQATEIIDLKKIQEAIPPPPNNSQKIRKLHARINKIIPGLLSPELVSNIESAWEYRLEEKTLENLIEKRECLFEKGILPTKDKEEIKQIVRKTFQDLADGYAEITESRYPDDYEFRIEEFHNSPQHREALRLMIYAGTLTPIVDDDWDIERTDGAQEALGISSLHRLQKVIADNAEEPTIKVFVHLHKGPGNGKWMHKLRHGSDEYINGKKTTERWKEVGAGYDLHHDPRGILDSFIRENKKEAPVFRDFLNSVLKPLIQEALKKIWFTEENKSGIREHIPIVDYFDNNVIYEVLANLEDWIHTNPKRRIRQSVEFAYDQIESMGDEFHYLFLKCLGFAENEIEKEQHERELSALKKERLKVAKRMTLLSGEHRLNAIVNAITIQKLFQNDYELFNFLKQESLKFESTTEFAKENNVKPDDQTEKRLFNGDLKRKIDFERRLAFLRKFFSDDFVEGVRRVKQQTQNENQTPPDLNLYCKAFPHNFVPGEFTQIPEIFGPKKFSLITSVRADSHETTKEFIEDVRGNCETLQPGAMFITDGIKHSYSRIYRLQELRELFAKNGNEQFKTKIVLDKQTNTPKSIIVQKGKKKKAGNRYSFFIDDVKKSHTPLGSCFREDVLFQDLEETLTRIDLGLLNEARTMLLQASADKRDVDIFNPNDSISQAELRKTVKEVMLNYLGNMCGIEKNDTEELDLIFNDVIQGKISRMSPAIGRKEWKEMLLLVREAVTDLIKKAHRAVAESASGEIYHPDTVHTCVREDCEKSTINKHHQISPLKLSTNKEFIGIRFNKLIQQETKKLKHQLDEIQKRFKFTEPLLITDFDECVTKFHLLDILTSLGLEKYIKYGAKKCVKSEGFSKTKGIYVDTSSVLGNGKEANNLTTNLLDHCKNEKDPIFALLLGNSAQQLIDEICKKYFHNQIGIQPGALEFGPYPIKVNNEHPFFKNCPERITITHLKDRHWNEKRKNITPYSNGQEKREHPSIIQPLAISELTGEPVAFEAMNGKILGIQGHLEIPVNFHKGFKAILEQIKKNGNNAFAKFGISEATPKNNINLTVPKMQGDAGKILILNALNLLSARMLNML